MKTITRTAAMTLFAANPTLTKIKFDGGKLNPEKRAEIASHDYPCGSHVKAIWIENRKDRYGPYLLLMCLADYTVR